MMLVVFVDMGDVFKKPFRFLPYCPRCNAEIADNETPCRKCDQEIEWFDPYKKESE